VTCAPFSCCTSLHAPQVFRAADDVIAHVCCWMEVGWDDVSHVYTYTRVSVDGDVRGQVTRENVMVCHVGERQRESGE
jgi:hypothetical protein